MRRSRQFRQGVLTTFFFILAINVFLRGPYGLPLLRKPIATCVISKEGPDPLFSSGSAHVIDTSGSKILLSWQ